VSNLRRIPYTKPLPTSAEIITRKGQRFARFKDRKGKTVEAPLNDDGTRIQLLSKKWYGEYRDVDGIEQCIPLSTDKTAAAQMLADLVKKAELGKAGITDPFEVHRRRPLLEHLTEFERCLLAKGAGEKHVKDCGARVRRVLADCRFTFLADLSASHVQQFLGDLLRQGRLMPPLGPSKEWYTRPELAAALGVKPYCIGALVRRWGLEVRGRGKARRYSHAALLEMRERLSRPPGPTTVNHYLRSLKSFTAWLVRDRRTGDDPFAGLSGLNASTDIRHGRRTLPPDELAQLLDAAATSPVAFRGLTGVDRYHLYLTACGTGFRAAELASLTPASFNLEADPPTATVPAAYTKNKRLAVQPLPPEVAEAMRGYLQGRPENAPIWPGSWFEDGALMLRVDLAACGIPYAIDGPDGPLYADFHALRHSFVALLDRAGLTLKQAMQLARHSDPKLTMARYGRAGLHDLGVAVEAFPLLRPSSASSEGATLAATGTDGRPALPSNPESLRQACAAGDAGRGQLRVIDARDRPEGKTRTNEQPLTVQGVEVDCDHVREDETVSPLGVSTGNGPITTQSSTNSKPLLHTTSGAGKAQLAPGLDTPCRGPR
jgi:integrase